MTQVEVFNSETEMEMSFVIWKLEISPISVFKIMVLKP